MPDTDNTNVAQNTEAQGVRVGFFIPREVDRGIEIEAAKRDLSKSRLVSDVLSAFLSGLAKS